MGCGEREDVVMEVVTSFGASAFDDTGAEFKIWLKEEGDGGGSVRHGKTGEKGRKG